MRIASAVLAAAALAGGEAAPLVVNGGFEAADPADARRPLGWDLPDGLGVQWLTAPGGSQGKAIRLDTRVSERDMVASWKKAGITAFDVPEPAKDPIAATYGLSHYSQYLPCAPAQPYHLTARIRGNAAGMKIWVRGYAETTDAEGKPTKRRIWESLLQCEHHAKPLADGWLAVEHYLHPTKLTPKVTELRVMLYAYWPPGEFWFDDVALTPVPLAEYTAWKDAELKAMRRPAPGATAPAGGATRPAPRPPP